MLENEAFFDGDSEVFENQSYLEIQDELQDELRAHIEKPVTLESLSSAQGYRNIYHDPTFLLRSTLDLPQWLCPQNGPLAIHLPVAAQLGHPSTLSPLGITIPFRNRAIRGSLYVTESCTK